MPRRGRQGYKASNKYLKPDQKVGFVEQPPQTRPVRPRIFLSHASKDQVLVNHLRILIEMGCAVPPNCLFYSSGPDTGVQVGAEINSTIKSAFRECDLFVSVLTTRYNKSAYCLYEAGAAWFSSKKSIVLVCPPLTFADIRGPSSSVQAADISSSLDLDKVRDSLIQHLHIADYSTARWNQAKDRFLESLPPQLNKFDRTRERGIAQVAADIPIRLPTLANVVHLARPGDGIFAILFDIDRMMQLNTHHGWPLGTKLLQATTDLFVRLAEDNDRIISQALCGDDTFYVLLLGTEDDAVRFAHKVIALITLLPLDLKAQPIDFTASAGVAAFFNRNEPALAWLERAHYACIEARRAGGNRVSVSRTIERLPYSKHYNKPTATTFS